MFPVAKIVSSVTIAMMSELLLSHGHLKIFGRQNVASVLKIDDNCYVPDQGCMRKFPKLSHRETVHYVNLFSKRHFHSFKSTNPVFVRQSTVHVLKEGNVWLVYHLCCCDFCN